MSYNLVLNNTNSVGLYKTQYRYNFISGSFTINEDSQICISQIVFPYSFFNVNKILYNNASLQYIFYSGNGVAQTYTVNFPDGFYTVPDLSNFLQQYMISQNQYFQNVNTGENEYFISIQTNVVYYTNQIICSPIPSSVPTGFIEPPLGFNYPNGFPNSGYNYTPRVIIQNNKFGSLIGYSAGTYPSAITQSSVSLLGNITPNITIVNSIVVICDLVKNECASPTNILDTITISNVSFGDNIIYQPSYPKWIAISAGTYKHLTIQLIDQDFNIIQANDNNIMISLLLKQGKKSVRLSSLRNEVSFEGEEKKEQHAEIIASKVVEEKPTIKPISFLD